MLLIVNFLAFPLLSMPAYGFIHYIDLHGFYKFTIVGWCSMVLTAILVWRLEERCSGMRGYFHLLITGYITSVLAWVAGIHKLIIPVADLQQFWISGVFAFLLGGLVTALYWLPASFVNFAVLRKRDGPLSDPRVEKT